MFGSDFRAWFSRWRQGASSRGRQRGRVSLRRGRRLMLEPLEGRHMLANDFGAIGGTVFQDLSDNGLTGDDLRVAGAVLTLYRDGGNAAFGGDDTLVGTRTTGASGAYRFDGLIAGTYFIQRSLPAGYIQRPGADMAMIVITPQVATGQIGTVIDTFDSTMQSVTASSMGNRTDSASMAAPEAIGGERDLYASLTSAAGAITIQANAFNQHLLEFNSTATARGPRIVTWDGVDGSSALNPTGLGDVDLTAGGVNTAVRLSIGADLPGGRGTFRIYTNAGNWSTATVDIPATGGAGTTEVLIPFNSFSIGGGSGADMTRVGAIQLEINGETAVDGQISAIAAVGPSVLSHNFALFRPMSVGNLVFNDANNSGWFDSGESGIAGVTVNLFLDADNSGAYSAADTFVAGTTTGADGTYRFDGLFPGRYVVQIPQSNFSAALNGYQSSTGNEPTPSPDNDVDNDDNGDPIAGGGAAAAVVTLVGQGEPTTDGDADPNSNLTVDFGFFLTPRFIDLAITKTGTPNPVGVNQIETYTLIVTNNGPTDATGVVVTDTLPSGISFASAQTEQGTFTTSGRVVTFAVGNMAVGASIQIIVNGRVSATASGTLVNVAQVRGNETETTYANNQAQFPVTVLPPPQAPNSSIGGFVYVDANNDGVKGANETPIASVTIQLTGTDDQGNAVSRTTTTGADGSYQFNLLEAGVYVLHEVQPSGYMDGLDTLGASAGGTAAQDDYFRNLVLGAGVAATDYNFGERVRRSYTKYDLLASSW